MQSVVESPERKASGEPSPDVPAQKAAQSTSSKGFLSGAALLISQSLLLNVLSVPTTALIIRKLGPLGYGQWSAALGLVALTQFVADPGIRDLFIYRVAKHPERASEELSHQLGIRIILTGIASALSIGICLLLRYPLPVLICVLINVLANLCSNVVGTLTDTLQALQRLRTSALGALAGGIVLTVASVLVVLRGGGPEAVAWAYTLGPGVNLLLLSFLLRREGVSIRVGSPGRKLFSTLHEARFIGFRQLVSALSSRLEALLVPGLVGMAAFGQYSAGALPSSRLGIIPDGLGGAFYPRIVQLGNESREAAEGGVALLLRLTLMLCLPAAILVCVIAPSIAQILFPKVPAICRTVMAITIWALPLAGWASAQGYSLHAAGKYNECSALGIRANLLGLAIATCCILKWGLMGCAWATIIRSSVTLLVVAPLFLRTYPSVLKRIPFGRMACALAALLAVLSLTFWVPTNNLLAPLLIGALGGLAYLGVCLLLGLLRRGGFSRP